jgi:uncharacterized membrane protein
MIERNERLFVIAAAVTGVGLSGFFDGILLHQVLQWHHLLSLVPGESLSDLRAQILADGLFHVLMYLITAAGLWLLWRARTLSRSTDWRLAAGGLLLGFGAWNVVDVGLFHWILGLHRVRINVPDPMLYDMLWLAAFGVLPIVLGWLAIHGRPSRGTKGMRALISIAVLAVTAGTIAALPRPGPQTAVVLLAPGSTAGASFTAAVRAGTPVLWADPAGGLMIVRLQPGAQARLYRAGAMLVTRSPVLAGCFASVTA